MQIGDADDCLYESSYLLSLNLERELLIPGVLTVGDKIMLVAQPKAGKSILVQQLASALAGNHSFLGFTPVAGEHVVLYVAAEGDVDELQERGRAMGKVMPVENDRLWYWPVPSKPLNTQQGLEKLVEFGMSLRPALTILDPIYALMSGSMKDDEPMGRLMRGVNHYQYATGSAVLLVHHSHRTIRNQDGQTIDEGDDTYFGSFVVKAWPRALWTMTVTSKTEPHKVVLACQTQRNRTSQIGTLPLMLAEPDPLVFVKQIEGLGASTTAVLAALKTGAHTQAELAERLDRSVSTISDCLTALVSKGFVEGSGQWPEQYTLKEVE